MGKVMIDQELLGQIVGTLKQIDVRGFDSMDMLVACVGALQSVYNTPPEKDISEQP